jgi:hypothetical protein
MGDVILQILPLDDLFPAGFKSVCKLALQHLQVRTWSRNLSMSAASLWNLKVLVLVGCGLLVE